MQIARSDELEADLNAYLKGKNAEAKYEIKLHIATKYKYLLALGSCIECGEEGIVGRGNALSGLISVMRPKGNEAYWGKNPVYHVGRVQMYLTREYSRELYKATGIPNTIYTVGVHSTDLIPPHTMRVHTKEKIDTKFLQELAQKVFSKETYLTSIIRDTITDNFLEKMI
jgi:S-adenosylmethionine synthetase